MISFLLSLVLGVMVILCLVLKMTGRRFSRFWNIGICVVIPIICILTFLATIVETSVRRSANAKELDKLLTIVELSLGGDRVFESNDEKKQCFDSLKLYSESINAISFDDSLVSIIAGHDTCMQRRIAQADNAVSQSIKWISRLNDIYDNEITFAQKEIVDGIKLIGPGADETSVLNIAFEVEYLQGKPICSYVRVLSSGQTLYSQAFEYKTGVNCFNIPTFNKQGEMVELGYICLNDDKKIFNYITYAK